MITTFHHQEFDLPSLCQTKTAARTVISCCVPTLNEEATIGHVVTTLRRSPLLDEVVIVDSGSNDQTREIAAAAGATVHLASAIRPDLGPGFGKGENLWKSLWVTGGEIVVFIDGDLADPHPWLVTGLVGPLLTRPDVSYVKGFYQRVGGGGRVTELLARPLLREFYPELTGLHQPLAGEYAARREVLEGLAFPCGYGVETAHLLDFAERFGCAGLAQTDLERRTHRTRPLSELGSMSAEILRCVMWRLHRQGRLVTAPRLADPERPPIAGLRR